MLRLITSLALVLTLGCVSQPEDKEPVVIEETVETVEEPVVLTSAPRHLLGPFIYQIITEDGYMGVEFIANGHVWTVKHMISPKVKGLDKCVDRGPHPSQKGLIISEDLLHVHQKLWYMSTHGPIRLIVMHFDANYIYVAVVEGVIVPGDSGSPVLSMQGEVVGCVSATYPKHPFYKDYKYGIIGRF